MIGAGVIIGLCVTRVGSEPPFIPKRLCMKPHKDGRFCVLLLCFASRNDGGQDAVTAKVALDVCYPPPPPPRPPPNSRGSDGRYNWLPAHAPPPPCFPTHHRMGTHKNIVGVESLSDVAGAEGLVMEIAVCDMFKACTGRSVPAFNLAQQIR